MLSSSSDLAVVERKELKKALREQELWLSGMVDAKEGMAVGKLTGAQLIVCGRAFPIEDNVVYTAKVISTETSQLASVMHQTKPDVSVSEAALDLGAKIREKITRRRKNLVPTWEPADAARELSALTAEKELPTLAFVIPEAQIDGRVVGAAAETELMRIAKEAGFAIIDVEGEGLAKWAGEALEGKGGEIPGELAEADVVIVGEGFSERGAVFDRLRTCRARLEALAVDVDTGEVGGIHRAEAGGVDLSEATAGKRALAAAAREIAVELLGSVIPK